MCNKNLSKFLWFKKFIEDNIYFSKNKITVIGNGSSNGVDLKYFDRNYEVNSSSVILKKSII